MIFHRGVKKQKLKTKKGVGGKTPFFPQIFFSPKKMELEDQKKIEMCLESIIQIEADLIREKYAKIRQDEQAKDRKNIHEKNIKSEYYNIAEVKRKAILRQKGLEWAPADFTFCKEESEKEFQKWKNLGPGDKIKEHRERIDMLQNDEDWEPMTDIQVDRWIEKENEKDD